MALLVAPSAQASWLRKRKAEPQVLPETLHRLYITAICCKYLWLGWSFINTLSWASTGVDGLRLKQTLAWAAVGTSGHSEELAGSSSCKHGVCKAQGQPSRACSRQERAPAGAAADSAHSRWHQALASEHGEHLTAATGSACFEHQGHPGWGATFQCTHDVLVVCGKGRSRCCGCRWAARSGLQGSLARSG